MISLKNTCKSAVNPTATSSISFIASFQIHFSKSTNTHVPKTKSALRKAKSHYLLSELFKWITHLFNTLNAPKGSWGYPNSQLFSTICRLMTRLLKFKLIRKKGHRLIGFWYRLAKCIIGLWGIGLLVLPISIFGICRRNRSIWGLWIWMVLPKLSSHR